MDRVELMHAFESSLDEIRRLNTEIKRLKAEVADLRAERNEARRNYQWMVEHACDQKLDGYRALGAAAAQAEKERDAARAEVERDEVRRNYQYAQAFLNALALAGPKVVCRLAADVGLCEEVVRAALQTICDLERELAEAQQTIQCLRDQNKPAPVAESEGEE